MKQEKYPHGIRHDVPPWGVVASSTRLEDVGAAPDAPVDVDFDFVLQPARAQVVHHLTEVEGVSDAVIGMMACWG